MRAMRRASKNLLPSTIKTIKGLFSKETVVLRRAGEVKLEKLVSSQFITVKLSP